MDLPGGLDGDFQRRLEAAIASGDRDFFEKNFPPVTIDPDDIIDEADIDKISIEDATKVAKESSASVIRSYELLGNILSRYEDIIRKRWLKKTQQQRKQILLKAWPNMAPMHRPHIHALRIEEDLNGRWKRKNAPGKGRTRFLEYYMWPSINLEDLCASSTLLRLINSRGRHHPALFVIMDDEAMRLGLNLTVIPRVVFDIPPFVKYALDLESQDDHFGTLSEIRLHSAADVIRGDRFQGDGLRVLEVQDRLLKFLVAVSQSIMSDKNLTKPLEDPVLPEPSPLSSPAGDWLSVDALARTAPYEVPAKLDLRRIKSLVEARVAEAQDHLWSLKEDPAYFHDYMAEIADHSSEMILDNKRKKHPDIAHSHRKVNFWHRMFTNVVHEGYVGIFNWELLDSVLDEIITSTTASSVKPQKSQGSKGVYDAVRRAKYVISQRLAPGVQGQINVFLPASPPMRTSFQRIQDEDASPDDPYGSSVFLRSEPNYKDDLTWLFAHLSRGDESALEPEMTALEFDRVLRDRKQNGRITAKVASAFTELGLIGAIQNQLRLYFPQVFNLPLEELHGKKEQGELMEWVFGQYNFIVINILHRICEPEDKPVYGSFSPPSLKPLKLGHLADPTSSRFNYPIQKRRSRENTEALRAAEAHLDELWQSFDSHIGDNTDPEIARRLHAMLPQGRTLLRTPTWVEPEVVPRPQHKADDVMEATKSVNLGFGGADTDVQTNFEKLTVKTKVKTKGVARVESEDTDETPGPDANPQAAKKAIPVKQRAFKVFSTLFYKPNASEQPGEIAWTEFLHAMSALFLPEKLYGSVWRFSPREDVLGVEQGINFHEPHPSAKLAYRTVRRYGRRLTRTYGLDTASFVMT